MKLEIFSDDGFTKAFNSAVQDNCSTQFVKVSNEGVMQIFDTPAGTLNVTFNFAHEKPTASAILQNADSLKVWKDAVTLESIPATDVEKARGALLKLGGFKAKPE